MTIQVALYARVSSTQQSQNHTIDSQVEALLNRIQADGYTLHDDCKFIDDGYSGSNIIRPALEHLRDAIANGDIDTLYIHSPDRLARKYAYQMILLEEFKRNGVELIFLNHEISESPEAQLLLQMQGMIAEYEREKILERNRRGKIHCAKRGSMNVLTTAPYGYSYISKHYAGGHSVLEINEKEADVVRKIFQWIGQERQSISDVCRRLGQECVQTRTGNEYWGRKTIWYMISNPVYKGMAAYGKARKIPPRARIRPMKSASEQSKQSYSVERVDQEDWIYIPVPALVSEELFEMVQEQLAENKKRARAYERGATYLLQGLLVCSECERAYCGAPANKASLIKGKEPRRYYRCSSDNFTRWSGKQKCGNKSIRVTTLDVAVWEEVKNLLQNPVLLYEEFQRRLAEFNQSSESQEQSFFEKQKEKIEKSISRLIDGYTNEYIKKEEFEPRMKAMRQHMKSIEDQLQKTVKNNQLAAELKLVVTNLESFSSSIKENINNLDWNKKRSIIRMLIKKIEIDKNNINIVYRIHALPETANENLKKLQHCVKHQHS